MSEFRKKQRLSAAVVGAQPAVSSTSLDPTGPHFREVRLDHISTPGTPMGKRKMCEGCGLKQPFYGLIRRAGVGGSQGTARCAGCGAAEGAVSLLEGFD